ncbi:hypothetical protein WJX77_009394 [Trebouxia sp. C0004]
MEPSAATEGTPGLNPVGGSFHAAQKKEPRKAKRSTFSRAARVTTELSPASRTSSAPAFHSQHGSFVWQHESVSKKGYTAGFASQTPRLGTSFRYTGPGPGSYRAPSWGDKLQCSSKACIISGPPTAQAVLIASIKQNRRVLQRLHAPDVPPPGSYTTNRTAKGVSLGWKAASGHKSAFEATARPSLMTVGDQPPPGAYETAMRWGQEEVEHSNFKLQPGHSKARHLAKHGALPAVLTADTPKQEPAVPAWCSLEVTPGPGAYELQKEDSRLEQTTVQRAAFGATEDGKAISGHELEAPGPGTYYPEACHELAAMVVRTKSGPSSSFKSKAARSAMFGAKAMLGKPPGPAFYSPHLPVGHRSFHFGAVLDSFVPAGATVCDLDAARQRAPAKQ